MTTTAVEELAVPVEGLVVREATVPAVKVRRSAGTRSHGVAAGAILALVAATQLVWAAGLAYGAYLLLG